MQNFPEHFPPVCPYPAHPVVGYARVSTKGQADDGGLEVQEQKMRAAAGQHRFHIITIKKECASAVDEDNLGRRPVLWAVVDRCRKSIAAGHLLGILVTDIKRLGRHPSEELRRMLEGIPIFSLEDGGYVDLEFIMSKVQTGAADAQNIRYGTHTGLDRARGAGKRLGSPGDPRVANRASVDKRRMQAQTTINRLALHFEEYPMEEKSRLSVLAARLNKAGIYNSTGKPWNRTHIRKPRREARQQLWDRRAEMARRGYSAVQILEMERINRIYG